MVCELMGREQEPPRARAIALKIKQAIKDDVGETLRCSIGMAPNRYLAKIASDMQKPTGSSGSCRRNCRARSPISICAICPASAPAPKSA